MSGLEDIIAAEADRPVIAAAEAFAKHLVGRFGPATAAVLFYGSCLRAKSDEGLILDFYVLVDRMGATTPNPLLALAGTVLPPNVYYLELPFDGRTVRAKVAVMTMAGFVSGCAPGGLVSAIWARFAQPTAIVFARTGEIRRRTIAALADAVRAMIATAMPLMPATFTARDIWVRALQETYRAELRPESPEKAAELVDLDQVRYRAVTEAILGRPEDGEGHTQSSPFTHNAGLFQWLLRRIAGRTLNVLRLIKATFTFEGGLDYAVWKIERHSGVKIELTDTAHKRPLITGLRLALKTWRKGGVR